MTEPVDTASAFTSADFERFRDWFHRKTGIYYEDNKRYFVDKRILDRMRETGERSFRAYFTRLRFQAEGGELQELINRLTVNETYFFREKYQFECMVAHLLDECVERKAGRPIRIWSIPCSTGEEPYSIALYLIEHWPGIALHDVEIIASDVDTDALSRCREGVYTARSVQHLPEGLLNRHFERLGGDRWRISKDIRESVSFERVNLADPLQTRLIRGIDIVFCRNLLIYFDDRSRLAAAQVFFDALEPGGFVMLGHSESMSRISSLFQVRKYPMATAYQKPR